MMEPDGFVHTLHDGACREDKNLPELIVPFDNKVRGMICYKSMLKYT